MEWQDLDSFLEDTSYTKAQIARLVKSGELEAKNIKGELFLRHKENLPSLVSPILQLQEKREPSATMQDVLQKVLEIHSRFALAKDEAIAAYKSENEFLKATILSMQEAYLQDKKMLEYLREEIVKSKQELESMQKKYQLMWNRAKDK